MDLIDNLKIGIQRIKVRMYSLGFMNTSFVNSQMPRGSEVISSLPNEVFLRVLAEMIELYKGKVYDPCIGSMFVQSERFIEEHGGKKENISGFGQYSNHTTWKLSRHIILFTFFSSFHCLLQNYS